MDTQRVVLNGKSRTVQHFEARHQKNTQEQETVDGEIELTDMVIDKLVYELSPIGIGMLNESGDTR